MAFHGDLSSYPLPELLQWLEQGRRTGTLQLGWEAGERKLFIHHGQIQATAAPSLWERLARAIEQGGEGSGQLVLDALAEAKASGRPPAVPNWSNLPTLATQELVGALADLTLAQAGHFHWTEDGDRSGDEWVAIALSLREALFESLRWLDEAPQVDRVLALDATSVKATVPAARASAVLDRLVLRIASQPGGVTLGRLRLALGLQRSLVARTVLELLRSKRLVLDGDLELAADPIADMLEKGAVLVRERQFEAAGLVFAALLQSDPTDRRVREFARMVDREHIAALYGELPPVLILEPTGEADAASALRPEERHLASLVNGRWDVSALVLASPQRELDTLKQLHKLVRLGVVREAGQG